MRPVEQGGLAFPDLYKYYLATQLVTIRRWLNPDGYDPATMVEAAVVQSLEALQALPFCGLKCRRDLTPLMITTIKVWKAGIARESNLKTDISPNTPLWRNPELVHLSSIQDSRAWTKYEVKKISQVIHEGKIA